MERLPACRPARRKLLRTLVAAGVLGVPAAIGAPSLWAGSDPLETAIHQLGFYPTRPPSRLREPGSLFLVGVDGTIIRTVCEADDTGAIRVSDTTAMAARVLRDANYALSGHIVDRMNAALDAKQVESVHYELTDVKVLEIAGDRLLGIQKKLQHDPDCEAAVDQLVRSREFVCQGVSVLLASATYRIEVASRRSASAGMPTDKVDVIAGVLREQNADMADDMPKRKGGVGGGSSTGSADEHTITLSSGEGLDYGVKLNELCLAPPEATTPRRLPRNVFERVVYQAWQLWPF